MNTSPSAPHRLGLILAIASSAAAALIFEIALTRIFAVTQFYHFAFMAVSLALLGYGASGSILAVFPALAQPRGWAVSPSRSHSQRFWLICSPTPCPSIRTASPGTRAGNLSGAFVHCVSHAVLLRRAGDGGGAGE